MVECSRFEYNIHLSLFIVSKSGSPQTSMEEAEVGRNEGKSDWVSVRGVCCNGYVCMQKCACS